MTRHELIDRIEEFQSTLSDRRNSLKDKIVNFSFLTEVEKDSFLKDMTEMELIEAQIFKEVVCLLQDFIKENGGLENVQ